MKQARSVNLNTPFGKAIREAVIWRDESRPKAERQRARKRFDYALAKVEVNGEPLNPMEHLHGHMEAVRYADVYLALRERRR